MLFSGLSQAELAPIPALSALVTDLTGTLNSEEITQLDAKLKAFETEKGSQVAVLIVPTTQPEDIAQYSIRVVDAWKIGRAKQDDGVLILVAKDDRKMRIEVGRGLEGAIPDLYAKRIIDEELKPRFKLGDFYGGITAATDKVTGLINGENLAPPEKPNVAAGLNLDFPTIFFLTFFATIFLSSFFQPKLGRFFGSAASGGVIGGASLLAASTFSAGAIGILAFLIALAMGASSRSSGTSSRGGGGYYGGSSSGGWSSGGSSWGGGGGGDFGGGGASGDW